MLAAEDIADMLHCPSGGSSSQEADCALLGSTPGTWDSATRMKRQRLLDSTSPSCGSGHSSQQQWQPQNKAAQPATAGPAAAAPPTPSSVAITGVPWQASYLFDYVQRCLEGLTALHPVCQHIQAHTRAAEMACAVFRHAFMRRSPAAQAALMHEQLLVQALLAASLWLALKFEANRTTTPDSHLMSRLTGIPAAMLRQQEREILLVLDWDLMTAAREVGAVGAVDVYGDSGREQQQQLAALALASLPPAARAAVAAAAVPPQHRMALRRPAPGAPHLTRLVTRSMAAPGNLMAPPSPTAGMAAVPAVCVKDDLAQRASEAAAHLGADLSRLWACNH